MGTTYAGFEAMAGATTVAITLNFYNTLSYCTPICGRACNNPVTTQSFATLKGIVEPDSNTNGSVYLGISPVQDSDLAQ